MKVKHIILSVCSIVYLVTMFLLIHFEVDLQIGASLSLGLFGVLLLFYFLILLLNWLIENWNKGIKFRK